MSKDLKILSITVLAFILVCIGFVWYRKKYPNGFSLGVGGTQTALSKITPKNTTGVTNGTATNGSGTATNGSGAANTNLQAANVNNQAANTNLIASGLNAFSSLASSIASFGSNDNTDLPDPNDPSFSDTGTDSTGDGYTDPTIGDTSLDDSGTDYTDVSDVADNSDDYIDDLGIDN